MQSSSGLSESTFAPGSKGGSSRLAHIDALRALAALLVIAMHAAERFPTHPDDIWRDGTTTARILYSVDAGRIGVVIFFVISGFVIPSSLKGTRGKGILAFIISRFFRLYPVFWLSVGVAAGTFWLLGTPPPLRTVLLNLTMVPDLLGAPQLNGVYWTLQVELFFYGLCAVLFLLGLLRNRVLLTVLAFYGATAYCFYLLNTTFGPAFHWQPKMPLLSEFLGLMFLGSLFRQRADGNPGGKAMSSAFVGIILIWLLVIPGIALCGYLRHGVLRIDQSTMIFPAPLGVLIFLIGDRVLQVRSPVASWIGRISYSSYLFHPTVMIAMTQLLPAVPADHWAKQLPAVAYILICIAGTLAFSQLTYQWVEAPTMALGKRLVRMLNPSKRKASAELAVASVS